MTVTVRKYYVMVSCFFRGYFFHGLLIQRVAHIWGQRKSTTRGRVTRPALHGRFGNAPLRTKYKRSLFNQLTLLDFKWGNVFSEVNKLV